MKCTNCGFELSPNSKFCRQCGTLVKIMSSSVFDDKSHLIKSKCSVCGAEIKEGHMFCINCRNPVNLVSPDYEPKEKTIKGGRCSKCIRWEKENRVAMNITRLTKIMNCMVTR